MSIPLDRLYYYIESIAQGVRENHVIIYRFFPHGSKNVKDLNFLKKYKWNEATTLPHIYCNDQEPLNFKLYENCYQESEGDYIKLLESCNINQLQENFQKHMTMYDKSLLLHSEKRGENLELYRASQFIPVYYWSHAVIALDWFRYAQHIQQKKAVTKTFLIYNRTWSGTREYRLGFADRLIISGLVEHTLMRVSPVDPTLDKHYDLHQFEHPEWRPHNVIEQYFPLCEAKSHSSADFDVEDYKSTDIEVVLETLFDDVRLHLTEKTLRPIAMGQPFILAGTYGSLKYLREYGFKTFTECWDESYDMMSDSLERMNKITKVMGDIVGMPLDQREEMLVQARAIADYNQQHFFSDKFQKIVEQELIDNFINAFNELEETNTCRRWFNRRKRLSAHYKLKQIITGQEKNPDYEYIPWYYENSQDRKLIATVVRQARQYYLRSLSQD